jgi:hypothetical protein
VISALAGVAIAGLPNSVGSDATIAVSATTVAPTSTIAVAVVTATTEVVTATTEVVTATTEVVTATTEVVTATTEVVAAVPATNPAETSTTVQAAATTTTEPPVVRADVVIVAINGAGALGLAGRTRDELISLGYGNSRSADGTTIVEETKVYYFDGFERAATDVALVLELDPSRVQPVFGSPGFGYLPGDQVSVYLGSDRA